MLTIDRKSYSASLRASILCQSLESTTHELSGLSLTGRLRSSSPYFAQAMHPTLYSYHEALERSCKVRSEMSAVMNVFADKWLAYGQTNCFVFLLFKQPFQKKRTQLVSLGCGAHQSKHWLEPLCDHSAIWCFQNWCIPLQSTVPIAAGRGSISSHSSCMQGGVVEISTFLSLKNRHIARDQQAMQLCH